MEHMDEAHEEMKVAQRLDPFSVSINVTAVWPVYFSRRFDEAVEQYREAVDIHPNYWGTYYWLGLAYEQIRELSMAVSELEKAKGLGDTPWRLGGLGHAYAMAGRRTDALGVLQEMEQFSKQRYVSPYDIAIVYAGLADIEKAFEWLERAFEHRSWQMMWIAVDPLFDSLHSDSRFTDLLKRVGLLP
jgi:tetratricopeptide (TPR) repeat protein